MASSDSPNPAGPEPVARIRYLVVDCLDLERSARFWGSLLGLRPVRQLAQYLFLGPVLPGCEMVLQQVGRVTTDKSPIHFDIEGPSVEDFEKFVARVEESGGTIVEYVDEAEYALAVMADPDGNEFCVNRWLSVTTAVAGLQL